MIVMQEQRFSELADIVHNVSRETLSDLEAYEQLLSQWHGRINLIAKAAISDIWQRHILDSVQLFPLALRVKNNPQRWLDVGSGGGFPGVVLAILIKHMGKGDITFIESNGKKAAFLRRVVAQLHLPAHVVNRRIETSYASMETMPDIITARALASLPDLLGLIAPFFGAQTLEQFPKSVQRFSDKNCDENKQLRQSISDSIESHSALALLPKGRDFLKEVEQAQRDWQFDVLCHPSITDNKAAILAVQNLQSK